MIELEPTSPLLVFGGPYSNLQATHAVMQVADSLGIPPDHVICTGDVIAYCAAPQETAAAIADWGCHVIQGNCEQQLAAGAADCACNFEVGSICDLLAKGWYPFAARSISQTTRSWMANLPLTLTFSYAGLKLRVIHGGVQAISRWVFASDRQALEEEVRFAGGDADIVLAGHCGLPFISRLRKQTWFNPGVIGMPANDGTADVWYGLVTPGAGGVVLSTHRLGYDHHTAAAALRRHGFANGYARTLITGRWPSLDILPDTERLRAGKRLTAKRIVVAASVAAGVMSETA